MAEYYLISQLPSLDGLGETAPLPITEERFMELCERFLSEKILKKLKKITLSPPKTPCLSGEKLIDAWNDSERTLRLSLAKVRAEKMNKPFDVDIKTLPAEYIKTANAATELDNPMEAEKLLNSFRLDILETLKPMDIFSESYLFYYAIKLKLILRIRLFDTDEGEKAYRNIYNSVLNGDRLEAIS